MITYACLQIQNNEHFIKMSLFYFSGNHKLVWASVVEHLLPSAFFLPMGMRSNKPWHQYVFSVRKAFLHRLIDSHDMELYTMYLLTFKLWHKKDKCNIHTQRFILRQVFVRQSMWCYVTCFKETSCLQIGRFSAVKSICYALGMFGKMI